MKYLYWLRAQWWKLSFWVRKKVPLWVLLVTAMLPFLFLGAMWIDKEVKHRAFIAEAERRPKVIEAIPVLMNVRVKYSWFTETYDTLGHTCRIIDGWFTFISLEDPKGMAHLSSEITDWTVCTPMHEMVHPDPQWNYHIDPQPHIEPQPDEPHSFEDRIDFREFVRP